MEGVVSILVFALLAAAVSMMIINSMRMTSVATREAGMSQDAYNSAVNKGAEVTGSFNVTFTIDGESVTVPVKIYDGKYNGGASIFTAFAPAPPSPSPTPPP